MLCFFVFFKQKTAYEMRISDWSSDVCSSDLYAVQNEHTPKWAKRVIYGALGYFIFPLDAIPDLAPLIGYTDDLSVMTAALATVAFYITPEVKAQARQKLDAWFNDPDATAYTDARDRKSTRLNSSHYCAASLPSLASKQQLDTNHSNTP